MVGSFLFSLGAGSLRPCIIAFGGDQFILPKQDKQLNSFYTYFYIAANVGMLTTGFILPVLRWLLFSIYGLPVLVSTIHWIKFIGQIHWTKSICKEIHLSVYFKLLYRKPWSITLFTFLLFLSHDVKCFGENSCYSLAFGTATISMVIATMVLMLGRTYYIKNNPVGSIMNQVIGIIWVKITFQYICGKKIWCST